MTDFKKSFYEWFSETSRRSDVCKLIFWIKSKLLNDDCQIENADVINHLSLDELFELFKTANINQKLLIIEKLSEIAGTTPENHWQIMEYLASFIREESIKRKEKEIYPPKDIQSAISAIGKRNISYDLGRSIDLQGANLKGADLSHGNFEKVNFMRSNLQNVIFEGGGATLTVFFRSSLTAVNFQGADLSGARFMEIDFSNANFKNANLSDARIIKSNCNGADFSGAKADKAILMESNLCNSNLSDADFSGARNLSLEQIKDARINEGTKLPF